MFEPGRMSTAREIVRFRTEAEAIARLQHPNIVQIFEIGEHAGLPFLALELAEEGTLARRLQQSPYAPRAAAELIETLARAVEHAHGQGIVHRDLKPANILFAAGGVPKITDFGLAKIFVEDGAESPRDATRSGEAIGTPRSIAPELAAGRHYLIGPGTDVSALGTLLYECLTGQVPFVSSNSVETVERIRNEEPASRVASRPPVRLGHELSALPAQKFGPALRGRRRTGRGFPPVSDAEAHFRPADPPRPRARSPHTASPDTSSSIPAPAPRTTAASSTRAGIAAARGSDCSHLLRPRSEGIGPRRLHPHHLAPQEPHGDAGRRLLSHRKFRLLANCAGARREALGCLPPWCAGQGNPCGYH